MSAASRPVGDPRRGRDARGLFGAARRASAALVGVVGLAIALALFNRASGDDAPAWIELTAPPAVTGLRLTDADGDGIADVFVVAGREVRGWRGTKGGLPPAEPTWTWRVPTSATFVAPGAALPTEPKTPTLLALAGAQALRLVPGKPPIVEEGLPVDVPWNDAGKAVLSDFVAGPSLLLPTESGFRWLPDWKASRRTSFDLRVAPTRRLTPPGPFVEDVALMESTWALPVVVAPGKAAEKGAVVALGDDGFHAFVRGAGADGSDGVRDVVAPTDLLPREGTVRDVVVDLDGDGFPDLVREGTTNDSGLYVFLTWSSSPAASAGAAGSASPTLVARSAIRLKGFQIPSDYVDLDADGRTDFVVTTIDIDNKNVLRAVSQGRVTARTRAFLNRGGAGRGDLFPTSPDAEIESDIRVRILFTFSGSIDVQRSFTILATADLDGDGRKDLAIRTPEGAMKIHRGTSSGVWEKDARTVAIPPVGKSPDVEGYVAEATGDKKDDLVLLYRAPPGGADRLFLLPSR